MFLHATRSQHFPRSTRGSALVECGILLPIYVILIFGITTFGQYGLLKKKALMASRYVAFGGTADDAKKNLMITQWEKLSFGSQQVKATVDKTTTIEYTPMKIMQKSTSSGGNPMDLRGGLDEKLSLTNTYTVDGAGS